MKNKETVEKLISYLDEKNATEIKAIDVSQLTSDIDTFIIATADNERLAKAISDNTEEKAEKELSITPRGVEGITSASWILMDYGDILIHIFTPETRKQYNLEKLWESGEILSLIEKNN